MRKTLHEIANLVDGEVLGDANLVITGIASLDEAREGDITFLAQRKYLNKAKQTNASAIIVSNKIEGIDKPFILTARPYLAYAKTVALFHQHPHPILGRCGRISSHMWAFSCGQVQPFKSWKIFFL